MAHIADDLQAVALRQDLELIPVVLMTDTLRHLQNSRVRIR